MARRQSINLPGAGHAAPIPNGAKVGNTVMSSAIAGARDPDTNQECKTPEEQAAAMFTNVRRFMDLAGGTTDDIIHMTLFMKEDQYREPINVEWLKMFPDEHSRPARHALTLPLRGNFLFQAEIVAVLDQR
ncbi:MAG: RidA family protein [Chloroflexi bacterium]|nr:RidA family protein [Chloroflexota bacterium]